MKNEGAKPTDDVSEGDEEDDVAEREDQAEEEASEGEDESRERAAETRGDEELGVMASLRAWLGGAPITRPVSLLVGLFLPAITLFVNMWRVRSFTIDDAFISYRFARNFARGLGLVYNPPERIEGYTNFLWTVILGVGIKLGVEPDTLAKILGGAATFGTLAIVYRISNKLLPYKTLPCVATWLLASTIVTTGYAVFGLETAAFVFFMMAGTLLFINEETKRDDETDEERDKKLFTRKGFPWSGVVFALGGLTRPEAPAYLGLLMLFLGLRFFSKRNILRGLVFAVPLAIHLLWRHSYYGAWVPNTLSAKTGNTNGQMHAGLDYIVNYAKMCGPALGFAVAGIGVGIFDRERRRWILAMTAIASFVAFYVVVVGGDWMPFYRFCAPFEPFAFILVDIGVRYLVDKRERVLNFAIGLLAIVCVFQRATEIRTAQKQFLEKEKRFWDSAAGGTADWFLKNNPPPGALALGDIGEVGYKTDRPILDLLGLVDPVISKLPGGYTQKLGPGFTNRFFEVKPEYGLIISSNMDCQHPSVPGSQVLYRDRRFLQQYEIGGKVPLDGGFAWCIYKRKH